MYAIFNQEKAKFEYFVSHNFDKLPLIVHVSHIIKPIWKCEWERMVNRIYKNKKTGAGI